MQPVLTGDLGFEPLIRQKFLHPKLFLKCTPPLNKSWPRQVFPISVSICILRHTVFLSQLFRQSAGYVLILCLTRREVLVFYMFLAEEIMYVT